MPHLSFSLLFLLVAVQAHAEGDELPLPEYDTRSFCQTLASTSADPQKSMARLEKLEEAARQNIISMKKNMDDMKYCTEKNRTESYVPLECLLLVETLKKETSKLEAMANVCLYQLSL